MQKRTFLISLIFSLTLALAVNAWAHATEKVLYGFKGGTDGAFPSSSLVMDAAGNLYGTASEGGNPSDCVDNYVPGCGVVYALTSTSGGWQQSVLYAFQGGSDGLYPSGNLVFDASGNLYGTTVGGGTGTTCSGGCGTVFQLSPDQDGGWTEAVLYSFQAATDGAFPAGLTFDSSGNLYGITTAGGSGSRGTVYKLVPPKQEGGPWTEKTLYGFSDFEIAPSPGLVFDSKGNLYGTYYQLYSCYPGCGAVFELKHAHGQWTETDLFDFPGGGNGGEPMAGVIFDDKGNLYGTGAEGGNNFGIAFELKRCGGQWKEIMLHNFCSLNNCADGALPQAGLVMDAAGVLYGTTSAGGRCLYCGGGVVFKLARAKNGWKETVLHRFRGGSDGASPTASLILDGEGNLYGTTDPGAYNNAGYGTVFEVMP